MSDLTISLTEDELSKVNSAKKSDSDLPKVYNKVSGTSSQISRDFEAFLILEDLSFKDKVSDKIKSVTANTSTNREKDLFNECVENEMEEIKEQLSQCASKVGSLNDLKISLQKTKYSGIAEISSCLSDILSTSNTLEMINRLTKFKYNYLNLLKTKFTPEAYDEQQIKQTQSWLNPLTAY
jgi:hypothetical protein